MKLEEVDKGKKKKKFRLGLRFNTLSLEQTESNSGPVVWVWGGPKVGTATW